MFDFSELKEAVSRFENNLGNINQYSSDAAAEENERQRNIDAAVLSTAQATEQIRQELESETEKRKLADAESAKYAKHWNRINLTVALLALSVAVAGLVVAIAK